MGEGAAGPPGSSPAGHRGLSARPPLLGPAALLTRPASPRIAERYLRGRGHPPRASGAGRAQGRRFPQQGGGPSPRQDAAAGSPSWGTRPRRLRAPARPLFTAAPFIPSPGAGRRNAIKRLSLEEMRGGGGGSVQRRAHCAGAEQRFSGPRPLSLQPVKRWVAGRSSAWNKIPTDPERIWGKDTGLPRWGSGARIPAIPRSYLDPLLSLSEGELRLGGLGRRLNLSQLQPWTGHRQGPGAPRLRRGSSQAASRQPEVSRGRSGGRRRPLPASPYFCLPRSRRGGGRGWRRSAARLR